MKKTSYLIATLAAVAVPAFSIAAFADNGDPGASGVIDGSDVRQFFGSGFIPNAQQMEEASIPFDKAVNIPWREKKIPLQPPQNVEQEMGMQTRTNQSDSASQANSNQASNQQGNKKKKKGFFKTIGGALASTANFIGFPVGEDNDVDATLASDLALPQQQVEDQKAVQRQMKTEQKQRQNQNQ